VFTGSRPLDVKWFSSIRLEARNTGPVYEKSASRLVAGFRVAKGSFRGLPASSSGSDTMPESSALMTPPSTIAHYKLTSKLGEGGMGAVYRATDTKLNRDVAIKVLHEAFANDAARMQRFEREARVGNGSGYGSSHPPDPRFKRRLLQPRLVARLPAVSRRQGQCSRSGGD
jgi:serine/threonine protein kinase